MLPLTLEFSAGSSFIIPFTVEPIHECLSVFILMGTPNKIKVKSRHLAILISIAIASTVR